MSTTAVPAGYVPPYPNVDRGPEILATLWALIGLSSIVVLCRYWVKIRLTRRLYYDDCLMLLALIFGIIHNILITIAVHYGLGHHFLYLDAYDRSQAIRWGIYTLGWGILSPMAGRIAFCITMLFLTRTDNRVKKWPIWLVIGFQAVLNITAVAGFYSQCGGQLDIFWTASKQELAKKQCLNPHLQSYLGYVVGAFNAFTDLFLTVLPAILIEHTRFSLKRKIGLAFLLCLSILALVAAIVKTYWVKALSEVTDYTWDLTNYVIWISIELNVVIICASIPLLRPLFRRRKQQRRVSIPDPQKWDRGRFGGVFSTKGVNTHTSALSISSEDHIVNMPQYEMDDYNNGITVTHEVSVTYEPSNVPFVHAALVGLIQGEIANPTLARR